MKNITTTDYGAAVVVALLAYVVGVVSVFPVLTALETGNYMFIAVYGFMCIMAVVSCTVFAIDMYLRNVRGYSQLDLPL